MDIDKVLITEREVFTQFLELYKDFPCLWDTSNDDYNDKIARHQAYQTLLECYMKYDKNANMEDMKKRLANMRAAYKREKRKVRKSLADESRRRVHVPNLWYYSYLTFLDDDEDPISIVTVEVDNDNDSDVNSDISVKEPERKRTKISTCQAEQPVIKRVYTIQSPQTSSTDSNTINQGPVESSADAFGRSVSSQLKELPKVQRCLAEKLIGEVMFYAKMDQLNMDTVVYLNFDPQESH